MGAGSLNAAVADAGPLIHLHEIGGFVLLGVFDVLHVPDAVWRETVGMGRVPEEQLRGLGTLQRHALPGEEVARFVRDQTLETLHDGERECLYHCRQSSVSILLTDDLAVREASKRFGITPVGSLGVIVRAYRLGRATWTDAERHMWDLHRVSTLYVTPAIVELAIQQLHAHPTGP